MTCLSNVPLFASFTLDLQVSFDVQRSEVDSQPQSFRQLEVLSAVNRKGDFLCRHLSTKYQLLLHIIYAGHTLATTPSTPSFSPSAAGLDFFLLDALAFDGFASRRAGSPVL